jgi:ComF family protein
MLFTQKTTKRKTHFWQGVYNMFFPRHCLLCEYPNGGYSPDGVGFLCLACAQECYPIREPCCSRCALPLVGFGQTCPACKWTAGSFQRLFSPWHYQGSIEQLIKKFKFHARADLAKQLVVFWDKHPVIAQALTKTHALVPIPTSPQRRRHRGYNQSLLLAEAIGSIYKIPVFCALKRIYAKIPQSRLQTWHQRHMNMRDGFTVVQALLPNDGDIMLIDDVATSTATLHAAALALKATGLTPIHALTLARAGA